jgi:hypothetical protein
MARCVRNKPENQGYVVYKRHRYFNGVCECCGQAQFSTNEVTNNDRNQVDVNLGQEETSSLGKELGDETSTTEG